MLHKWVFYRFGQILFNLTRTFAVHRKKGFVAAFLRSVCVTLLITSSLGKEIVLEKSLEKVSTFGFKNLYEPCILLLKANSLSFGLSYPSQLSLTKLLWHDLYLVNMDLISAKELLVLAQTADEQKQWVLYLSKKIVRKEPKIKSASVRYVISPIHKLRGNWIQPFAQISLGLFGWTSLSYDWSMVSKATNIQSYSNDPRKHRAESFYLFSLRCD